MVELRYCILFVSDLERSIRFYRDLIGLRVLAEDRDQADLAAGPLTLTLHQARVDAPHHHPLTQVGSSRLGFHVEDVDVVHARLMQAYARCLAAPETRVGVRMGLYEDPDGFNFTIASDTATP